MADRRGKRCGSASKERQTVNKFANDGSFLEMFKKKMEEQKALGDKPVTVPDKDDSPTQSSETDSGKLSKTNILSIVGKRRGGSAKVLKTGMVKKPKQEEDVCICLRRTVTALHFLMFITCSSCSWLLALLRTSFTSTLFMLGVSAISYLA
ncbi:telomerase RNA component interacting RNase-like isoform X1 [Haliotis rufescens]|uniref:telomerase RNA component interacting RNase-like isoform X1 n=1 Tax=Haliotis rufescens TaxID=6454 RepID=UPI00201EEA25|nr:telomerase RNA component interacting RNase-like isoform X1 [Haliotis rufescens]